MRHTFEPYLLFAGLLPQASGAATLTSDSIDLRGQSHGPDGAVILCSIGAVTGSPDSFIAAFRLQDSANDSDFDDVPIPAQAETPGNPVYGRNVTTAETAAKALFLPGRCRRYIRVECTLTFEGGTSPEALVSCPILFAPREMR